MELKIDKKKQAENRALSCRRCKEVLMRYGSTSIAFPEYKELRAEKVYRGSDEKSQMKVEELWHTDPLDHSKQKRIGLFIKCRCGPCGQFNKFQVIFRPYQQFVKGSLV